MGWTDKYVRPVCFVLEKATVEMKSKGRLTTFVQALLDDDG
jgi:hypothetical protein